MVLELLPERATKATSALVGTLDYYDAVLGEVNSFRARYGGAPLSELPRAWVHGTYDGCALGRCFPELSSVGRALFAQNAANHSPLLRHYERSFEHFALPEVEPA